MKIKCFCIIFLFLINITLKSQTISFHNIDTTDFPLIKAKFFAFDKDGIPLYPTINDIKIKENSNLRKIININTPIQNVDKISVSFANDIHSSNLLIPIAVNKIISNLKTPNDELSILSNDYTPIIVQDFSNDKTKLSGKISSIDKSKDNILSNLFLNANSGIIPFNQKAKNKKKIVIIFSNSQNIDISMKEKEIIDEANKSNIKIYSIMVDSYGNVQNLYNICVGTGGRMYTYQSSLSLENIIDEIFKFEHFAGYEISWESNNTCEQSLINGNVEWNKINYSFYYSQSQKSIVDLNINPVNHSFGEVNPNSSVEKEITFYSKKHQFTIDSIKQISGFEAFKLKDLQLPITVFPNSNNTIKVLCSPPDSNKHYAVFEIKTDLCKYNFSLNCGTKTKTIQSKTLNITKPKIGETYFAGLDSMISWEGISPSDTVDISYSFDNGNSWRKISKDASGLNYNWKNIPLPESKNCKIKIEQFTRDPKLVKVDSITNLIPFKYAVDKIEFSNSGNKFAVFSRQAKSIKIYETENYNLLNEFKNIEYSNLSLKFNYDESLLYATSTNGEIVVYDLESNSMLKTFKTKFSIHTIETHPSKNIVFGISSDSIIYILDGNSGQLINKIKGKYKFFLDIYLSADGKRIYVRNKQSEDSTSFIV